MICERHLDGSRTVSRVNPQNSGHIDVVQRRSAADALRDEAEAAAPSRQVPCGVLRSSLLEALTPLISAVHSRVLGPVTRSRWATLLPLEGTEGVGRWVCADLLAAALESLLSVLALSVLLQRSRLGSAANAGLTACVCRGLGSLVPSLAIGSDVLRASSLETHAKSWVLAAGLLVTLAALLEAHLPVLSGVLSLLLSAVMRMAAEYVSEAARVALASALVAGRTGSGAVEMAAKTRALRGVGSAVGVAVGAAAAAVLPVVMVAALAVPVAAAYVASLLVSLMLLPLAVFNAPRMECFLTHFNAETQSVDAARKKEDKGGSAAALSLSLSPASIARVEPLLVLPASLSRGRGTPLVRVEFGASLRDVLADRVGLSAAHKHQVVNDTEGALATKGCALLYDEDAETYYCVYKEGVPRAREAAALPHGDASTQEPPSYAALEDLWAYFYAFQHTCARLEQRHGRKGAILYKKTREEASGNPDADPVLASRSPIHVIHSLREDGMLDLDKQSATHLMWYRSREAAAERCGADTMYPVFTEFLRRAVAEGWDIGSFLTERGPWSVSIEYL